MKLTFISFLFIHLIRMIVCYFTFSSFFLSLIERRKARLIDGRSKLLKLDEFLSLFYFWLIDWNQFSFFFHHWMNEWNQLMTTDILALVSMKNAAKCEKPCELHNTWIIKSLNASGAWEVASKHVCLRVVFINYNQTISFLSFSISFIHFCDWLIDLIWKKNRLFVVCFIWFVCLFVSHSHSMKFRWDELRESSLFVCFTFKQRCLFISTTNQSMNEPNQFQLTLICDWLIWLLVTSSTFFLWLIDWLMFVMDEWIWIIDWLINFTHSLFIHSLICVWLIWLMWDWLIDWFVSISFVVRLIDLGN